ncbi:DoxX family protein [Chitinophaga sp. Mgbs1]|uniref:DoxX family protein n=1 Tax=Chitinophaga solisilvae TaxID=1233460 RepID=A0A3S1JDS6_9BACT|nr:DoxX family protein [Chitinophaga solisilvae]
MKTLKIAYWGSTSIIVLVMLYSGFAYLTQPALQQGFQHLGYPGYFRVELGIAKLIGAVLLVVPVSARVREWVYAGFAFTFISAFIAHAASGDPIGNKIGPVIFLAILGVSYAAWVKRSVTEQRTQVA